MASQAFIGCDNLVSVNIPESVTSIGQKAFDECSSLKNITVAAGNKKYSSDCQGILFSKDGSTLIRCPGGFAGHCIIPKVVTGIEETAFSRCSDLTGITIPESVTSIAPYAFAVCDSLLCVTIPAGVTSIETGTFSDCGGLQSITIPNGIIRIGDGAFRGCKSLTSITIPESVTSIGQEVFYNCSGLVSITVAANNPNYSNDSQGILCSKDDSTIICCPGGFRGHCIVPKSVTSIGPCAFRKCKNLNSITIPDSVTCIGKAAFYGCCDLASITLPKSVVSVGNKAFFWCSSLKSVIIPEGVTSIGKAAFDGCGNLVSITIPDSVVSISDEAFGPEWQDCGDLTIHAPSGSYAEQFAMEHEIPFKVI